VTRTLLLATFLLLACERSIAIGTTPPLAPSPTVMVDAPEPVAAECPTHAQDPLADVTLPARPEWMDRYASVNKGDMRFFDISTLMSRHQLDRAAAVELQNHYRDRSRSDTQTGPQAWFDHALAQAKEGRFEDRRDLAKLRDAPFIVVFDLDETLYDQSYPAQVAERCHDIEIKGEKTRRIKLAPGAGEVVDRVAALGGAGVIFSANTDERTVENLRAWEFGGKPLPEHPAISGVLTNSHLVLQSTHAGPGAQDPKQGQPVLEPSKDLRIFDESLTKVILVDDNPLRTFQPANVRIVQKFDAERWCANDDAKVRRGFERNLKAVADEIEESVRWMRSNKSDFVTAYLPYTQSGALAIELLHAGGMSRRAAVEHIRKHPQLVEREF
jgi:hypothetical protein